MRVSDTERQRAIDELGRHLAAGRLDAYEYSARVEAAAQAAELVDLDRLLVDLPMLRIADPAETRRRAQGAGRGSGPGRRPRWQARLIVLVTVAFMAAGIVLAVIAQWVGLAVLFGAWMVGALQGWLLSTRR